MICVYVPLDPSTDYFTGPFRAIDADGKVIEVNRNRVDLVDLRLCFVAHWLGTANGVRHRVRFADGQEAIVTPSPEWRHVPYGSEPLPGWALPSPSPLAA